MASTLRYLKEIGLSIVSPNNQLSANISHIIHDIKAILQSPVCNGTAIVYTDGSTATRSKPRIRGPLWSGGLVVRADGNNFRAELAAAAVVLKACPKDTTLALKIDSTATIGAISKGIVSERKRVRA